jgi:hypothetical protein
MDLERTFITLTPERLSKVIMDARRRVIYAAPSLTMDVAAALIHSRDRLGAASVVIVLDVTEGVLRLGYGLADALSILKENNVSIRDETSTIPPLPKFKLVLPHFVAELAQSEIV